jgi:hypothetical protein
MKLRIKDVIALVDVPAITALAQHQLAAGHTREEVISDVVAVVDALIPWSVLIPGPAGVAVETLDGPIATAIATLIVAVAARQRRG